MSLLDGLLLSNLLEGIKRQEVYIALRKDLKNDPNRFGAGTSFDPFDGSKTSGGVYKLDVLLYNLAAGATIHLAPGIYPTQGTQGFRVKSGWRILGGGWAGQNVSDVTSGNTVLRLEGHVAGENFAIGCGTGPSEEVVGFELFQVSIDARLPNSGTMAAGGIDVNGCHIRINQVRIFNFGSRGTPCDVIRIARPSVDQPNVFDNVASDCVVEKPSANSTGRVNCLKMMAIVDYVTDPLNPTPFFHRACVFRSNYVDCGATSGLSGEFVGVDVAGGTGTIVEMNRIWNCQTGGPRYVAERGDWFPTQDLIFRENHFFNVLYALYWQIGKAGTAWQVSRLTWENNLIELATTGSPVGIEISCEGATSPVEYKEVVLRRNEIRHVNALAGPATIGINLDSIDYAVVEENLINVGPDPENPDNTTAIVHSLTGANVKTFDNQSTAGKFLGCWDGSRHRGDLITDLQDMVIGLM